MNKETCAKDTGGVVNDTLPDLLPKRTSADANFCDERYGTGLIEYDDIKNFARAYATLKDITATYVYRATLDYIFPD